MLDTSLEQNCKKTTKLDGQGGGIVVEPSSTHDIVFKGSNLAWGGGGIIKRVKAFHFLLDAALEQNC